MGSNKHREGECQQTANSLSRAKPYQRVPPFCRYAKFISTGGLEQTPQGQYGFSNRGTHRNHGLIDDLAQS